MAEDIPPIDTLDLRENDDLNKRIALLEFDRLEAESKLLRYQHRETQQRYVLKWGVVILGLIVIIFMACVLMHLSPKAIWGPFFLGSPAFSVAMIVAPITSITAIVITFFVGTFRKFEDHDVQKLGDSVAGAAAIMRGS